MRGTRNGTDGATKALLVWYGDVEVYFVKGLGG